MRYDQNLLDIVELLREIGISNDQTSMLHHFSLSTPPRRETINSTIKWVKRQMKNASEVEGRNIAYFKRLIFIHDKAKSIGIGGSIPNNIVNEALSKYPLTS
jgi:hypothetical protein